jgi:hypothetical protein
MDHSEAIQLKAAERYLLGELTGTEREQYEEHFFGCHECAQDVQAGAVFMDNAREVLASETMVAPVVAAQPREQSWFSFFLRPAFAAPALALLLLVAAYQNVIVIPRLKTALGQATEPQVLSSFSLIAENSRGGAPLTIRVPLNKQFSLFLDIPPGNQFPYYNCELLAESGKAEFSVKVLSTAAKDTIQLLVPASRLSAGKHVLIVRGSGLLEGAGAAQSEVARYSFILQFTK